MHRYLSMLLEERVGLLVEDDDGRVGKGERLMLLENSELWYYVLSPDSCWEGTLPKISVIALSLFHLV